MARKVISNKEYVASAGSGISSDEQETVVNFSRDDTKVNVWTSDTRMIHKIQKFTQKEGCEWTILNESYDKDGRVIVLECEAPVKAVRFVASVPKGPTMTEEQRQANAERLRRYGAARRNEQAAKKEGSHERH